MLRGIVLAILVSNAAGLQLLGAAQTAAARHIVTANAHRYASCCKVSMSDEELRPRAATDELPPWGDGVCHQQLVAWGCDDELWEFLGWSGKKCVAKPRIGNLRTSPFPASHPSR